MNTSAEVKELSGDVRKLLFSPPVEGARPKGPVSLQSFNSEPSARLWEFSFEWLVNRDGVCIDATNVRRGVSQRDSSCSWVCTPPPPPTTKFGVYFDDYDRFPALK